MKLTLAVFILSFHCHAWSHDVAANERRLPRLCMDYAEAQEIYRRTDWDSDGVLEYAQGMHGGRKRSVSMLDISKLPTPSSTEQAEIEKLIAALGADDFETRERAHLKLLNQGTKAYKQIDDAIKPADDAEKRERCAKLVLQIREALAPEQKIEQRWGLYTSGREDAGEADVSYIDAALAKAECPAGFDRKSCTPKAGYLFRILTTQGPAAMGGQRSYIVNSNMILGYALVAFPSEYGKTGQRIYMINNNGTIYARDFGSAEATDKFIESCTEFNPDKDWKPVE